MAADVFAHHQWLGPKPPEVEALVRCHGQRIYDLLLGESRSWGPTTCHLAAPLWFMALESELDDVVLWGGNYNPGHEPDLDEFGADWAPHPASTDHCWLTVGGAIFDPTASQFGITEAEHYWPCDSYDDVEEFDPIGYDDGFYELPALARS